MERGLRDNPVMVGALAGSVRGAGGPARLPPCFPLRCGASGSSLGLATKEWGYRVRMSNVLPKTLDTGACDRAFLVMRGCQRRAREARSVEAGGGYIGGGGRGGGGGGHRSPGS